MTGEKDPELSPEEKQFNQALEGTTMEFGELEDQIRNMPADKAPQPTLKPAGAPNLGPTPAHIKVQHIRQQQDTIKNSLKLKATEITKYSSKEIRDKVLTQYDSWAKSDIYEKCQELREKNEIKFKENNSDIQQGKNVETKQAEGKGQIDQEDLKGKATKNIEQDSVPQNQGFSSYDPTSKLAGTKFMDNKDDILADKQPDKSEVDIDSKESSEPEPLTPGEDD